MTSDQDEHRDKRKKIEENIEESSASLSTPSASRPKVRPPKPPVPIDPLSTSNHFFNIHPSAAQRPGSGHRVNPGLNHDVVDYSASKGKGIAQPFGGKKRKFETINEDVEMRDAVFSADHKDGEENSGGSDHPNVENGMIDYSASQGQRKAFSSPEESRTETAHGSEDRSKKEPQDEEKGNFDDENMDAKGCDDKEEGVEHYGYDDDGIDASGSMGVHRTFVQISPAEPVDPPLQEFREGEDGEWDIGPKRN